MIYNKTLFFYYNKSSTHICKCPYLVMRPPFLVWRLAELDVCEERYTHMSI